MLLKGETRTGTAGQKFQALERDEAIVLTVSLSTSIGVYGLFG